MSDDVKQLPATLYEIAETMTDEADRHFITQAAATITRQAERIAELEADNHRIQCELNDKTELWHMADESARKWERRYIDLYQSPIYKSARTALGAKP